MMNFDEYEKLIKRAILLLAERCPRLRSLCYWAGTSSISTEVLRHRISFDLDFHTRKALIDVRPILAEIQNNFPGHVEVIQTPDQFGSSFRCILVLPEGERITLEVLSNFEDVQDDELVESVFVPEISRISLSRYLADKIQCVAERAEARDLIDISAVIKSYPDMKKEVCAFLLKQDVLLLTERLITWTDKALEADLKAYTGIDVKDAIEAREELLSLIKRLESGNK